MRHDQHGPENNSAPGPPGEVGAASARASQSTSPLITAIEIENFKGVGRPVRIDLRPITLLFGRNSAGKSTILHALCYAHEILCHRNVDAGKVELGGDQIDLGGFRNLVHAHDLDREVRLRLELDLESWRMRPPDGAPYLGPVGLLATRLDDVPLLMDTGPDNFRLRSGSVELAVAWNQLEQKPVPVRYEVGVNETLVGRIRPDAAGNRLEFNWAHPLFAAFRTGGQPKYAATSRASEAPDRTNNDWRLDSVRVRGRTSLFPDWDELLDLDYADLRRNSEVAPAFRDGADWSWRRFEQFEALLSELFVGVGQVLRGRLAALRYLGPVRKLHPPASVKPGSRADGSWSDGSAAWNLLLDEDTDPDRRDLLKDVNDWLARDDRLDTGYRLERRTTVELPADEPVSSILYRERLAPNHRRDDGAFDLNHWARDAAATIVGLYGGEPDAVEARIKAGRGNGTRPAETETTGDPENPDHQELVEVARKIYQSLASLDQLEQGRPASAVRNLIRNIAAAPHRTTLQLVSAESGMPVRTADVGVGISQILPVVVAALDPRRPDITAIEQPELHLHPRLQVELGDLFAQPIDKNRVFLLENHSEHLMLRLLRRIEETHSAELPEGKPPLKPDHVSVLFLEQVDGEVRATPLRIDETGEFIDRWPQGFFDERDDELF